MPWGRERDRPKEQHMPLIVRGWRATRGMNNATSEKGSPWRRGPMAVRGPAIYSIFACMGRCVEGRRTRFWHRTGPGWSHQRGMSVLQVLAAERTMDDDGALKSDTGLAVSSLTHPPCCRRRQHANATVSRIPPTRTNYGKLPWNHLES